MFLETPRSAASVRVDGRRAAGIDHRNGVVADDKCHIGNGAFVVAAHERQGAGVNEDPRRHFRHGKRRRSSFVGNGELLRMGTRLQLGVGNDMYRTHNEHECRSNRRQPVTHVHAFRVGPMPSQRHHQISMVHNHRAYRGAMPRRPHVAISGRSSV